MTITGLAYGLVPSRRLGKSLGINNVLPKNCSYSCAYCQLGHSKNISIERRFFHEPLAIFQATSDLLAKTQTAGEKIDYLCFVPDGEPCLDINLGKTISMLKKLQIPVGVITNSSLLWRQDVREELSNADWVSVKIDSVSESIQRKINHPHRNLESELILKGLKEFANDFKGKLVTETMIIRDTNDNENEIRQIAEIISTLNPDTAYLSIPTRPPAEKKVKKPTENFINLAYQIFSGKIKKTEYLIGYEGNSFAFSGNAELDILNITAVHPMRSEAISALLNKAKASEEIITRLITEGKLRKIEYEGHTFYLRKFS